MIKCIIHFKALVAVGSVASHHKSVTDNLRSWNNALLSLKSNQNHLGHNCFLKLWFTNHKQYYNNKRPTLNHRHSNSKHIVTYPLYNAISYFIDIQWKSFSNLKKYILKSTWIYDPGIFSNTRGYIKLFNFAQLFSKDNGSFYFYQFYSF